MQPRRDTAVPGWALVCAALLPVLLTAGWVGADALQPASYSPVRQTMSVLAGYGATDRWIMTGVLYLMAACYAMVAAGLRVFDRPARAALSISAVAAVGVASLPEPAHGSRIGHVAWAATGALSIAAWPAIVARPGSAARRAFGKHRASVASVVSLGLLGWTLFEARYGTAVGLAERTASSLQVAWPCAVAVRLHRTSMSDAPEPAAESTSPAMVKGRFTV